jgi:hypothetical protein
VVTNPILLPLRGSKEVRLRRRTYGFKPSADVNLSMCLSAVMPCPSRIGRLGAPFDNSEIRVSALNHEPMNGIGGYYSTNLTTEFAYGGHGFYCKASDRTFLPMLDLRRDRARLAAHDSSFFAATQPWRRCYLTESTGGVDPEIYRLISNEPASSPCVSRYDSCQ